MRPARKGPENVAGVVALLERISASMRPARKGPENNIEEQAPARAVGFNEAGPQGAGKPAAPVRSPPASRSLQ